MELVTGWSCVTSDWCDLTGYWRDISFSVISFPLHSNHCEQERKLNGFSCRLHDLSNLTLSALNLLQIDCGAVIVGSALLSCFARWGLSGNPIRNKLHQPNIQQAYTHHWLPSAFTVFTYRNGFVFSRFILFYLTTHLMHLHIVPIKKKHNSNTHKIPPKNPHHAQKKNPRTTKQNINISKNK